MTGFDPEWLELRAPADEAARSRALVGELAQLLAARPSGRFVDLATGTGANVRALAPSLAAEQRWLALDSDPALLESVPRRMIQWAEGQQGTGFAGPDGVEVQLAAAHIRIEVAHHDLAPGLAGIDLSDCALLTASALLDLVSHRWLSELVECSVLARVPVYFALTYDGAVELQPAVDHDGWIIGALNRHQQRDKGFGPALGPAAAGTATELFEQTGFRVASARSNWQLGPHQTAVQIELFEGWARAALDLEPKEIERIDGWLASRRSLIAAECSTARIGHVDVLAWPEGTF